MSDSRYIYIGAYVRLTNPFVIGRRDRCGHVDEAKKKGFCSTCGTRLRYRWDRVTKHEVDVHEVMGEDVVRVMDNRVGPRKIRGVDAHLQILVPNVSGDWGREIGDNTECPIPSRPDALAALEQALDWSPLVKYITFEFGVVQYLW